MEIDMIKRLVLTVLALALFTGTSYAAEMKIGVVDVRAVIASTPQREAIKVTLQNEFKERGDALKSLEEEIVKLTEQRQNDAMTMSNLQMTELVRNIEAKGADFQLKQKALQEDFIDALRKIIFT